MKRVPLPCRRFEELVVCRCFAWTLWMSGVAALLGAGWHPVVAATPSQAELEAGWIQLFDGESLYGWTANSDANWAVRDGVLQVNAGTPGFLWCTTQFDDFELRVDFRAPRATNSGVFLRSATNPQDPRSDCYELNIAGPDHAFPTGSLVARQRAAAIQASHKWRAFHVRAEAGTFVVKLDDHEVLAYRDQRPLGRGRVGLQFNQGDVAFRNIWLRPLGLTALSTEPELSDWTTYPDLPGTFQAREGVLTARGGPGQLETKAAYGDFVLQLSFRTNARDLNSGVFFRCLPGQRLMGYESQIHNGCINGDRDRPADCGTGGIFRRQDARRIVADDLAWTQKTIVAHGPHIGVWVNGFQVTDWTDTRTADANPRRGLRLEPGTLMLQAHDPSTDVSFRNVRVSELSPRNGTREP